MLPPPRVVPLPRVNPPPRMYPAAPISQIPMLFPSPIILPPNPSQPMAHQTRSRLTLMAHAAACRKHPLDFRKNWAFSAINTTTGQTLEHRQLFHHTAYKELWSRSYSNKIVHLFQGVGSNPNNTVQHVKCTNTFKFIRYENIPRDRCKDITSSKVVCLICPEKADPNRTRITIGGNRICYPGDAVTKTASLDLFKRVINSVISRKDAKYVTFDISNFYLQTHLECLEYVRIKFSNITQDFIDEYDLLESVRDVWVYFKINRGVYDLPQSSIFTKNLLEERLSKNGYYQCTTTPGLWR